MSKKTGSAKVHQKNGRPVRDDAGRKLFDLFFYVGKKQVHRRRYFKDKPKALRWIARERGDKLTTSSWTECLQEWQKDTDTTEGYQLQVERSVCRFVEHQGDGDIEAVTPQAMAAYLRHRAETQSAAAANKDQRHLLLLARWARSQLLIETIPFEHLAKVKYKAKERKPVSLDYLPTLLDDLDLWTRPIVEWIACTGMRQQDAANIKDADIEADRVVVRVKGGGEIVYLLDDMLKDIIQTARQLKAAHSVNSYWLFCNSAGGRWTDQHLSHRIKQQWPDGITLHCLRHTWGTEAGKRFGADMVQSALGHKSRAAGEVYAHVTEDAQSRHKVGTAVRAAIRVSQHTNHPQKQHTNNTRKQKHGETTGSRRTEQEQTEATIDGHKILIPKALAQEILDRYTEG